MYIYIFFSISLNKETRKIRISASSEIFSSFNNAMIILKPINSSR